MELERDAPGTDADVKPQLGLWDTVGIIVGIVVGTAIFITPPLVFRNVKSHLQRGHVLFGLFGSCAIRVVIEPPRELCRWN